MDVDNKQLERDIENAIRARGLKEQMKQWDAMRQKKDDYPSIPTAEAKETTRSKGLKIRRTIYSLSAVALLAGVLVMAVPASTWRIGYIQVTRWAYKQYAYYFLPQKTTVPTYENTIDELMAMATPSVKQVEDSYYEREILGHENLMHEAIWLIIRGDYAVAQDILKEVRQSISSETVDYQTVMEDVEYLNALCYLGQNERAKAKKLLMAIAESESRHRDQALELAKEIK